MSLLHADTYLVPRRLVVLFAEVVSIYGLESVHRERLTTRLRSLRHSLGEHSHEFLPPSQ